MKNFAYSYEGKEAVERYDHSYSEWLWQIKEEVLDTMVMKFVR